MSRGSIGAGGGGEEVGFEFICIKNIINIIIFNIILVMIVIHEFCLSELKL